MAVILPTTLFAVRRATVTVDGHGTRSPSGWGAPGRERPGRIVAEPAEDGERDGPGMWVLAVDPAEQPLRARDLIVEPSTGRRWVVATADARDHAVDPAVDWIRVQASLQ
ncbi:hypothetical protein SAMN05421505_12021 [Sinosporangium album]|uniref:Uncharacterized protein n=1 Tax=Sinosporangium album TaxID=504805 RepID=A0A1G8EB57_9ACTN|nr:hypothetical protein SAMN05421505_12021 [Sinosporangium album]